MNFKQNPFFIRLLHWEYWPFSVVYAPTFPVYCYLALKAKSLFFFSTSNPGIKNGGYDMESKFEIDTIIPHQYRPESIYFEPFTDFNIVENKIKEAGFSYPIIIKPDIGNKGLGVKKLENADDLLAAIERFQVPFIIQPFVDFSKEIGLFFVKIPGEEMGKVTGIVRKEYLSVTGDGKSTVLELLQSNPRHVLQIPTLKKTFAAELDRVLPLGSSEVLVPYGNHVRGCLFLDDSHRITPALNATFNKICSDIQGFYFGRMDIKFNSWQELEEGKNFSIIELNGAGSQATHVYDPKHSLFFAWKESIRHLNLLYKVSTKSKRLNNLSYMSFKEGMKLIKDQKEYAKKCAISFS